MNIDEYKEKVKRTMNKDLTRSESISMLCMGLSGETGELVDMMKKSIYHGHEFDKNNTVKEIGDILWYLINLCNELSLDVHEIMDRNIEKLQRRYPEGFDQERSKNRVVV